MGRLRKKKKKMTSLVSMQGRTWKSLKPSHSVNLINENVGIPSSLGRSANKGERRAFSGGGSRRLVLGYPYRCHPVLLPFHLSFLLCELARDKTAFCFHLSFVCRSCYTSKARQIHGMLGSLLTMFHRAAMRVGANACFLTFWIHVS